MNKLFLIVTLFTSSSAFAQESSYNVTTYAGGKSINVRKDVKRFIAIFNEDILVRSVGERLTYHKRFDIYSTKSSGDCTDFWTKNRDTKKIVLFTLCEDEVTPFIKKVNYSNGEITKVIYYYYND